MTKHPPRPALITSLALTCLHPHYRCRSMNDIIDHRAHPLFLVRVIIRRMTTSAGALSDSSHTFIPLKMCNDYNDDSQNNVRRGFERLLRKIQGYPNRPAVVLLHTYSYFIGAGGGVSLYSLHKRTLHVKSPHDTHPTPILLHSVAPRHAPPLTHSHCHPPYTATEDERDLLEQRRGRAVRIRSILPPAVGEIY